MIPELKDKKQDQRSQKLTLRETKKAKSNRKVPNPEISLSTAIYKITRGLDLKPCEDILT